MFLDGLGESYIRRSDAREFKGKIELDVRDSVPDWSAFLPPKAPEGAPNVLVILYDDTGMAPWFTGGTITEVVFDVADDAYIDVETHLAAAMERD